jgi:pilus assembly protein Flp/PilA
MLRLYVEASRVYAALKSRLEREEGQAMVEYALILALVSVIAIAILTLMGQNITTLFGKVNNALTSANNAS